MADGQQENDVDWRRESEELRAQLEAMRAEIDALRSRADAANHRADTANHRADASEARAEYERLRVDMLEVRVDVDQQMIGELQADGLVNEDQIANLTEALRGSRKIGAAIGILMANRRVDEERAYASLMLASQHSNRKVRVLAEEVVRTGDVSDLPRS